MLQLSINGTLNPWLPTGDEPDEALRETWSVYQPHSPSSQAVKLVTKGLLKATRATLLRLTTVRLILLARNDRASLPNPAEQPWQRHRLSIPVPE